MTERAAACSLSIERLGKGWRLTRPDRLSLPSHVTDRRHVLAVEARKEGRLVGRATYSVSDDGRTLTATVGGIDAAGKAFDQIIVFDREPSTD